MINKTVFIVLIIFFGNQLKAESYSSLRHLISNSELESLMEQSQTELLQKFKYHLSIVFDVNFNNELSIEKNKNVLDEFINELIHVDSTIDLQLSNYQININTDIYLCDFFLTYLDRTRESMASFNHSTNEIHFDNPFNYHRDANNNLIFDGSRDRECNELRALTSGAFILKIDSIPQKYLTNGLMNQITANNNPQISVTLLTESDSIIFLEIKKSPLQKADKGISFNTHDDSTLIVKVKSLQTKDLSKLLSYFDEINGSKSKVILDIRGFQGGALGDLVSFADLFLDQYVEIISSKSPIPKYNHEMTSRNGSSLGKIRLIVLTNNLTRYGANIIVGALKYYNKAVIVGEKTAQGNTIKMSYSLTKLHSYAQIAVGKFTIGLNDSFLEKGVSPDFHVKDCVVGKNDDILEFALNNNFE